MTRILIADDHQLLRQALRRSLEDAGYEIVGEATDGGQAIAMASELTPDIVMMDVTMPVLDGVSATTQVVAAVPGVKVVMLTMHGEASLVVECLEAGACAFLTKDISMAEVVDTVNQVAGGEILLSPEIARDALEELTEPGAPGLTKREVEVLQLVADGYATTEIGEKLFISAKTVKNHLASIYDKLGARDRTQAVLSAVRSGIVSLR